ncbi:MAG: hypothetical protein ACRDK7_02040 [Solirubrobacteraceae bacterium]
MPATIPCRMVPGEGRPKRAGANTHSHPGTAPLMTPPQPSPVIKRLETWLWTGPVGHFAGGALDFAQALASYLLARARGRTIR